MSAAGPSPNYKWIVLSNTTIGMLLATALSAAFTFSFVACLVAAWASWLRGGKYHYREEDAPVAETSRVQRAAAGGAARRGEVVHE